MSVTHTLTTLSFARGKATICSWTTTLGLPERIIMRMATSDECSNMATLAMCILCTVFKRTWIKSTNVHGSKESSWPMSLENRLRTLPEMKRKKPFSKTQLLPEHLKSNTKKVWLRKLREKKTLIFELFFDPVIGTKGPLIKKLKCWELRAGETFLLHYFINNNPIMPFTYLTVYDNTSYKGL